MSASVKGDPVHKLDHATPGLHDIKLGKVVAGIITSHNALVADHAALLTKYEALLAHIDAGAVAGLGTSNVANYSPPAVTAVPVGVLGTY